MAIKCPDCGHMNPDEMAFCEHCGEPIDPKTRLIMELEGTKSTSSTTKVHSTKDEDEYVAPISTQKENKKKSPLIWVLAFACAAALIYFFFLR